MAIKHLVLPMAGVGKRLRPLTLKTPKPLIPVGGRPMVDYVLEEATAIGIRDVVCVISREHAPQIRRYLRAARKKFPHFRFHVRFQEDPVGNGHAILQAADIVAGKPFIMRFVDDVFVGGPPLFPSLEKIHDRYRAPVVILMRVPRKNVARYGIVGVKPVRKDRHFDFAGSVFRVTKIVEKPSVREAPSNFVHFGDVVTPALFRTLTAVGESLPLTTPDALPLTLAIQVHLLIGKKVYAWEFTGKRLDGGTLDGLAAAEKFLAGRG